MMYLFAFFVACAANSTNLTDQLSEAILHDMKRAKHQVLTSQDPPAVGPVTTNAVPANGVPAPAVNAAETGDVAATGDAGPLPRPSTYEQRKAWRRGYYQPAPGKVWVDKKGYEEDWQTEHRSEEYPEAAVGKMHHPDYHPEYIEEKFPQFASAHGLYYSPLVLCALFF